MKRLETKKSRYWVIENEDGTLLITHDKRNSIDNAGLFILQMGGVETIKARLQGEDLTLEQAEAWEAEHARQCAIAAQQAKERAKQKETEKYEKAKHNYEALLATSQDGVIPTTYENIGIVLRYLNTLNWGAWELPKMSIGYSCHQYDCDGRTASTMKLDKAIEIYEGEKESMFQVGAPHGHLTRYRRA